MKNKNVVIDIAGALLSGKKLTCRDAYRFGSAETAFPRRIKDIKEKMHLPVTTGKTVTPGQSKVSLYYI